MDGERRQPRPGVATLTKDAIARYRAEVEEQSAAVAARFGRLMEMGVDRLSEIPTSEPDSLLERAEAAVRQLKRFPFAGSDRASRPEDA